MFAKLFKKRQRQDHTTTLFIVLVFSLLALSAAFILSVEKINLLENPNNQLSCSINPIVNCASVMKTPQASVFGFPNSYLGLMFFSIVAAFAVMGLLKTRFSRYTVQMLTFLSLLALIFAYWLFFQSLYVIQVLCPWCLLVTLSTTAVFSSLVRYLFVTDSINLSKVNKTKFHTFFAQKYDVMVTATVIFLLTVLVYLKFGNSLFLS